MTRKPPPSDLKARVSSPLSLTSVNLWAHNMDYAGHFDTETNAGGEWSPRLGGRVSLRCCDLLEAAAGGPCRRFPSLRFSFLFSWPGPPEMPPKWEGRPGACA